MQQDDSKILLIIENQELLNELTGILRHTLSGEQIIPAANLENGLSLTQSQKPDLILIDHLADKTVTYVGVNALRNNPITKDIPILYFSSHDEHSNTDFLSPHDEIIVFYPLPVNETLLMSLIHSLLLLRKQKQRLEKLSEKFDIFSQFIKKSPVYLFIKEVTPTESRVLQASDNYVDMIGIPGSQMTGKTMEELFPAEFAKKISEDDWAVVSKGKLFQEEETFNNRTYLTIKFPFYQGDKILLAGYTIDINDQKTAEASLRTSEAHFRSIVDNSDAGYFYIDRNGIIQDVNQAWVNLYKFDSAEEIIGQHFTTVQKIEDAAAANELVNGIMQNNPDFVKGEFSRKCKDGSTGYHTFSARPVYKNSEVIGIEGFIIDTTEHRLAVEALRASEERYHLIDEASQDSIYSYDRDSRFTHANTFLCQQLQLTQEQILGKTHEELGYPQNLCDEWAALHQRVYDTNETVVEETTSIMPDGSRKHFEVVLNPIHDGEGNIIGIAGTTRDIHERKMAEAKIREQMAELKSWHNVTMGREERILDLKREVNQLLQEAGKPPKYKSVGE
jgi:PAS domain S-box-containing protein